MFQIRCGSKVIGARNVEDLMVKLPTFIGQNLAVHFYLKSGIKRIVFISVSAVGQLFQSYGQGSVISKCDFIQI